MKYFILFLLISGSIFGDQKAVLQAPSKAAMPLLFQYEELKALPVKTTTDQITKEELLQWDSIVENLMQTKELEWGENSRLLAYLYNAQNAFAEASFFLTGSYSGHIGPVSLAIVQLFYPDYQGPQVEETPFSRQLGAFIGKKFEARFKEEQAQLKPMKITMSEETWKGTEPLTGITIPSKKFWILSNAKEVVCTSPPPQKDTQFWRGQFEEVKRQSQNLTDAQKEKILFWADGLKGNILLLGNQFMFQQNIPLEKILQARALVSSTISDTFIVTAICKYTYLIKRPFMLDPQFKTFIPTPNHPSYPSAHSTTSSSGAVVLSYLFPENSRQWTALAEEAGQSRIWAGIHFPIDNQEGLQLGEKIGKAVIQKVQ